MHTHLTSLQDRFKTQKFKGFNIWLYNKLKNKLVEHVEGIMLLDDLVLYIEKFKNKYKD